MSYEDASLEWSELVPGGVIVYYADGAEEILHANKYVLDLCECRDFDEFLELTGGTFRGFVKASDIDAAEDSIWGQVSKRGGLDHVYHQIRTRSNKIVSVDDYGRLVRSEGRRPVFYVFLVEMERHSVIDWLTGLPGMERFDYLAGIEAGMIERRGKTPVLLLLDIMGMKSYNALYGRDEGDRLICRLATAMRHAFGSDLCCRNAGDSFCSIAPADEMEARAKAVFEEFSNSEGIAAPPIVAGACAFEANESIANVLDKARLACELDHNARESHLTWFTEKMRNEAVLRAHVLESLDEAIAKGWISPYYQGIVRTSTGRLCCVEVLSRWFDPKFGTLLPGRFIPYLEEASLIRKIDLHLVTCVAKDIASRLRSGLSVVPASINIYIGHQYDPGIARQIAARVDAEGVSRSMLRFEVAESIVSSNPDILKAQVDDLHSEGFEVWLDNFGSGLSSFNLLKEIDFDLIKLDMSFLMEGSEQKRSTMIEGVIQAAKSLGVKTLAEGVETYVLAQEMAGMGCDMLQGFSFSVPSLSGDFEFGGKNSMGQEPEPLDEIKYWDEVGLVSLKDLAVGSKIRAQGFDSSLLPAGIIERRDGKWYILRATEPLIKILQTNNAISRNLDIMHFARHSVVLDDAFHDAVGRCEATQSWERVDGPMEYGTGFLISVKPLTQCACAHAFLLGSTPSPLGSALGTYGDVPVGYAVFSMVQNSDGRTIDATYVYANERYRRWGGIEGPSLVGRSILDASPGEGEYWLTLMARVAKTRENLHDVVYSSKAFHWLSYSVTPSLVADHCILAYTIADAEQRERQELIDAGTHDALTGLLNRRGIDSEIQRRTSEGLGQGMVIILLDLDDFKAINDLHGHDAGDEALRSIAINLLEVFPIRRWSAETVETNSLWHCLTRTPMRPSDTWMSSWPWTGCSPCMGTRTHFRFR